MRQSRLYVVVLILALLGSTEAKQDKRSVALPINQAQSVRQLCSRDTPLPVEAGWVPRAEDIAIMEKRFNQIRKVQDKSRDNGMPIRSPRNYYRQYVGVVIGGKKQIYINAICHKPPKDWRERVVDECDGACNWGVLYDVETGEFSNFGMNGIG